MSAVAVLRAATAADHEAVDAAFGTFDLADTDSYRRFLLAHAHALIPVEQAIAAAPGDLPLRPRAPLIAADLAALGATPPTPAPLDPPGQAALWGMRYVVEGSRLGGTLLARRVGAGLPAAYLGAQHLKGEWRTLLTAFDAAADAGGEPWLTEATAGAHAAFALYARSATEAGDERG